MFLFLRTGCTDMGAAKICDDVGDEDDDDSQSSPTS
jgi:hypothetical protein